VGVLQVSLDGRPGHRGWGSRDGKLFKPVSLSARDGKPIKTRVSPLQHKEGLRETPPSPKLSKAKGSWEHTEEAPDHKSGGRVEVGPAFQTPSGLSFWIKQIGAGSRAPSADPPPEGRNPRS
jgi:hypothetical protein